MKPEEQLASILKSLPPALASMAKSLSSYRSSKNKNYYSTEADAEARRGKRADALNKLERKLTKKEEKQIEKDERELRLRTELKKLQEEELNYMKSNPMNIRRVLEEARSKHSIALANQIRKDFEQEERKSGRAFGDNSVLENMGQSSSVIGLIGKVFGLAHPEAVGSSTQQMGTSRRLNTATYQQEFKNQTGGLFSSLLPKTNDGKDYQANSAIMDALKLSIPRKKQGGTTNPSDQEIINDPKKYGAIGKINAWDNITLKIKKKSSSSGSDDEGGFPSFPIKGLNRLKDLFRKMNRMKKIAERKAKKILQKKLLTEGTKKVVSATEKKIQAKVLKKIVDKTGKVFMKVAAKGLIKLIPVVGVVVFAGDIIEIGELAFDMIKEGWRSAGVEDAMDVGINLSGMEDVFDNDVANFGNLAKDYEEKGNLREAYDMWAGQGGMVDADHKAGMMLTAVMDFLTKQVKEDPSLARDLDIVKKISSSISFYKDFRNNKRDFDLNLLKFNKNFFAKPLYDFEGSIEDYGIYINNKPFLFSELMKNKTFNEYMGDREEEILGKVQSGGGFTFHQGGSVGVSRDRDAFSKSWQTMIDNQKEILRLKNKHLEATQGLQGKPHLAEIY